MKLNVFDFLLLILVSGILYFSSCSSKNPTTGTLGITVIDNNGNPITYDNLYLATSLDNLRNSIYSDSMSTDNTGKARFLYLLPNYYWYRVHNWANYGAIQVYAGNDYYATLEVTDPASHK
jgi:hypothetical protein